LHGLVKRSTLKKKKPEIRGGREREQIAKTPKGLFGTVIRKRENLKTGECHKVPKNGKRRKGTRGGQIPATKSQGI